jgi:hypothetical protein
LADDIIFVGYSLPLTDLTFGSMFRDAAGLASVRITVVDRDPAPILTRLQNIGIDETTVRTFGGDRCVADFVTEWIRDLGAATATDLRTSDVPTAPMFVAWERERHSPVVGTSVQGTEVVLRLGPVCAPGLLGRRADAIGELTADLPTPAAIPEGTSAVLVELPDGGRQTVIGTGSATFDTGYREWNTLFTSGRAPAQHEG